MNCVYGQEILGVKHGRLAKDHDKYRSLMEEIIKADPRLTAVEDHFYHVDTLDCGDHFRLQGYVFPDMYRKIPRDIEMEVRFVNVPPTWQGKDFHTVLFIRNWIVKKDGR